jgi:RimJ/RimL family protein N-acetyltransferase
MISVRTATLDDSERIADIHVKTWQAAYAGVMPKDFLERLDVDARQSMWRRAIEGRTPPGGIFVAEKGDELVGFTAVGRYREPSGGSDATVVEYPAVGEVFAIYVGAEHWSTGAGHALMRTAVDHLADQGLAEIRLWVLADNPRARRFYERFGYLADGKTRVEDIAADYPDARPVEEVRCTLHVR